MTFASFFFLFFFLILGLGFVLKIRIVKAKGFFVVCFKLSCPSEQNGKWEPSSCLLGEWVYLLCFALLRFALSMIYIVLGSIVIQKTKF